MAATSEANRMTVANLANPRLLTEREAAAYLGAVSVRTLQDWRARGIGLRYHKLGKRVAYDLADLDAFIAANRVEPKNGEVPLPRRLHDSLRR